MRGDEVLPGLWRFAVDHPEWEPGQDWPREVAWHLVATGDGAVAVDPLLEDGDETPLDGLVDAAGGCAGVVRTVFWHERSTGPVAERYGADVWALPGEPRAAPFDRALASGEPVAGGLVAYAAGRGDEAVVWCPEQHALIAGDVLLRGDDGALRRCPDSWLNPRHGPSAVIAALAPVRALPIEHVLVSHGPLRLGDGAAALERALDAPSG
jgi:hypothetical protein